MWQVLEKTFDFLLDHRSGLFLTLVVGAVFGFITLFVWSSVETTRHVEVYDLATVEFHSEYDRYSERHAKINFGVRVPGTQEMLILDNNTFFLDVDTTVDRSLLKCTTSFVPDKIILGLNWFAPFNSDSPSSKFSIVFPDSTQMKSWQRSQSN